MKKIRNQIKKRHLKKYKKILQEETKMMTLGQLTFFREFIGERTISSLSKLRKVIIGYRDSDKFKLFCILKGLDNPSKL